MSLPKELCEIKLDEQKTFNGQVFPLVLTPTESTKNHSPPEWSSWVEKNKEELKRILVKYGVLFFRGFSLDTAEEFDAFVKSFGYDLFPYIGGYAPRKHVKGNVYTANESPAECKIPFHHELAQLPVFPQVIFFFCDVAPPSGGQTSIAPSNIAYELISARDPQFVKRLEKEGICYIRYLPDVDDKSSIIGSGWQSTYATNDRKEAERAAEKQGTKFEWLPDGSMKTTSRIMHAVHTEERTNLKTWFNNVYAAYTQDSRQVEVTFPNGDFMTAEDMQTVGDALEEIAVNVTWKHGDVMMVDNRLALHGRKSATPPRRILACLCKE